jgi:hypothetical protein
MRFLYTGTVIDTLDFDGKEVYLTPETEVELPEEIEAYPYFQKLIANGILKAVSPASTSQEAAK